eukprot:7652655-Pyramimonas_sp.AAC.1
MVHAFGEAPRRMRVTPAPGRFAPIAAPDFHRRQKPYQTVLDALLRLNVPGSTVAAWSTERRLYPRDVQ